MWYVHKKRGIFLFFTAILIFVWIYSIALGLFQFNFGSMSQQEQNILVEEIRISLVKQLIENNFDRFETMPFGPGYDNIVMTGNQEYPNYPKFLVKNNIVEKDDLDILIEKKLLDMKKYEEIILTQEEIENLNKIYLFKNNEDLEKLWYVISSYRTRWNDDNDPGRTANIMISFWNIGNVRVLNPWQELSFMDEIHYNPENNDHKKDLANGFANIWWIRSVRWWWICGGARWINAAVLPNKAIEISEWHVHSRTYKSLYKNNINGQESWIPGLDTAVYSLHDSKKDFIFKNIRKYPIVLIMNFDWIKWNMEEVFVISKEQDRGELKYIGRNGNCFSWEANGEKIRSCYSSVLW